MDDQPFRFPLNMTCAIAWGFEELPGKGEEWEKRFNIKQQVAKELNPYGLWIYGNNLIIGEDNYCVRAFRGASADHATRTTPDTFPRTCQKAIDIIRGKEHTP